MRSGRSSTGPTSPSASRGFANIGSSSAGILAAVDEAALDRVLADAYVGDVTALEMSDLRAKRAECQALEVGLSYQRRLAQGRLDIVAAERRRRAEGGDPPSHDDLVRNLAATLADRQRPPGNG